jgi:hypothetical protein
LVVLILILIVVVAVVVASAKGQAIAEIHSDRWFLITLKKKKKKKLCFLFSPRPLMLPDEQHVMDWTGEVKIRGAAHSAI